MSYMSVKDLIQVEATLAEAGYDYQLELEDGKIIVVGPSDVVSSEIGVRFIASLFAWVNPRRLGRVFDSAGGFILPDSNLKAPDVSFVRAERLKKSPRYFAQMVPDLVVEIKSQSDKVKALEEKLQMFLKLGAVVGILIDPDTETVTVYRGTGESTILKNGDVLTIAELLPGWELPIREIWPPVFE
ncbi:MAG: Uma2 family endonuclease [Nostocaceae cyanobacterium]|nr:Uma2 family endonuclease [Nostocaceae cyanobacterium]